MSKCKRCGIEEIELIKADDKEYIKCKNGHFIGAVLARTIKDKDGKIKVYWPDTGEYM